MTTAHLRLVASSSEPATQGEQLMLRPVLTMIGAFALEPPLRARTLCRRPAVRRPRAVLAAEREAREGEERRRVLLSTALIDYVPRTATPPLPSTKLSAARAERVRARADVALARRLGKPSQSRKSIAGARSIVIRAPLNRAEKEALALDEQEFADAGITFPPSTDTCPRHTDAPCPWFRCGHHLGAEVEQKRGGKVLKVVHPDLEVDEMPETCSLRAADRFRARGEDHGTPTGSVGIGGPVASLVEVGELMNLTPERLRHYEESALRKIRLRAEMLGGTG
jgi:hypothetical protein